MERASTLISKELNLENIILTLEKDSNRKIYPEFEVKLAKKWEDILKDAKEQGKLAYDNPYCLRLNNFQLDNKNLELKVSYEPFSKRFPIFKSEEIRNLAHEYWAKGLFICSFIKTSDNKYIFGKRSGKTLASHDIDFIGGGLDKKIEDPKTYLKYMLFNEFKEEINLEETDISTCVFKGMIVTFSTLIGIMCNTTLRIDSNSVLQKFNQHNDNEMSSLEIIDEKNILNFLDSLDGYRKTSSEFLN
jgi:hypothetical protein